MFNLTKARNILTSVLLSSSIIMVGFDNVDNQEAEMKQIEAPVYEVPSNILEEPIILPEVKERVNVIEGIQYLELTELTFAVSNYENTEDVTDFYSKGSIVAVRAKLSNEWYELLDGGYIREEFVKVREDLGNRIFVRVTADSLNKRQKATPRSKYMGALSKGALHSAVAYTEDGWYQLLDGTYINSKYTERLNVDKDKFYSMVEQQKQEIKAKQEAERKAKEEEAKRKAELAAKKKKEEDNKNNSQSSSQGKGTYSSIKLSSADRDLLARLIYCEANVEPYSGQVGVAQVVFNRVLDKRFPNTVEGVIKAKGQFVPVSTGKINRVTPTAENYKAIDEALVSGGLNGAVYFHNPKYSGGSWWNSLTTVASIGNHSFKK